MITRPGAYQNRPCPPPSVRSRSDRPATAPVHHRHSLPGTVATFVRYRASTAGSVIAAATAVRPASSSRRTGTRSPAPGRRQPRRTVAALLAVATVGLVAGEPPQPRRLPNAHRLTAPLDGLAQG